MSAATAPASAAPGVLTTRETEILTLVGRGLTSGAIAARLGLTCCTVESHIRSAREKLGARTRLQAAALMVATTPRVGDARNLRPEELRLLDLLSAGSSLAEAAAALHVSVRTAARRLAEIRASLGVRTTAEAVTRPRLGGRHR
jgi:DNA-binding NarL/FixJ family response regulator